MLHIKHHNKEYPAHTLIGWTQQYFVSHTNSNTLDSALNNVYRIQTIMDMYSQLYSAPKV
jgi:hypothetical protein